MEKRRYCKSRSPLKHPLLTFFFKVTLLSKTDHFPKLKYLGFPHSFSTDDLVEALFVESTEDNDLELLTSKISTLDLSLGELTEIGCDQLIELIPRYHNIQTLKLKHHKLPPHSIEALKKILPEFIME